MIEIVVQAPRRPRMPLKRKSVKNGLSKKKKPTQGKLKPKTLTWYKRELDRLFSLYIREKYPKECYTCRNTGVRLQNGHFISRMYLSTRWSEDNCRPQCQVCNMLQQGRIVDFEEHLIREIGAERVQALKDKRKELWKLDRNLYEEKIAYYKALALSTG